MKKLFLIFPILCACANGQKVECIAKRESFYKPVVTLKTEKFIIQIDSLPDYTYRYTSWGGNKRITDTPDLVLLNGKHIFEGSGGNNKYEFQNNEYLYIIQNTVLGTSESVPYEITIYKGDKKILNQPAVEI